MAQLQQDEQGNSKTSDIDRKNRRDKATNTDRKGLNDMGSDTKNIDLSEGSCEHCAHVGYVQDKKKLVTRLRRIEGQVRAITAMVENDTYCIDVLTQIAAANSALKSVALLLLEDHLDSCVATAAAKGGPVADEKMDEAVAAIKRLVKS